MRISYVGQVAWSRWLTQSWISQIVEVTHLIIERILIMIMRKSRRKVPGLRERVEKSIERCDVRSVHCSKFDSSWKYQRRWCRGVHTYAGSVITGL
jgi:hypothetical protein